MRVRRKRMIVIRISPKRKKTKAQQDGNRS